MRVINKFFSCGCQDVAYQKKLSGYSGMLVVTPSERVTNPHADTDDRNKAPLRVGYCPYITIYIGEGFDWWSATVSTLASFISTSAIIIGITS